MGGDIKSPLSGDVRESLEALELEEGDDGAVQSSGAALDAVSLHFLLQFMVQRRWHSIRVLDW